MAKMAKQKQTDYTKGGRDVSNTAIPYWQNALGYADDYLADPTKYIDTYLNKYWSNNANQSDFLRNYNRAMAGTTANNYAATQGGYSSAGKRAYNDQQYYQNDLASRLQTQGVKGASDMANSWYGNLLNTLPQYQAAYGAGKAYSDVDQYNYIAKQNNSFGNQLASNAGAIGTIAGAALAPFTGGASLAIGSALGKGLQGALSIDPSSALLAAGLGSSSGGSAGTGNDQWSNLDTALTNWYTNSSLNKDNNANSNTTGALGAKLGYENPQPYTTQSMINNSGLGGKNYWGLMR